MVNETTDSPKSDINKKLDRFTAALFFTFATGIGFISAFGISFIQSKKQDSKKILKKLATQPDLNDAGVALARRALFRATVYSVGGVSLLCFSIWKLSGAKTFEEFRYKIGNTLPKIKRKEENSSRGRTEFKNLTELFQYLIDEDIKSKDFTKND
jgi:hypothetical protein